MPSTSRAFLISAQIVWYWIIVALTITTTIVLFTIPEGIYPIVYLRSILAIVFLLFLPGFSLLKTLYPSKVPLQTTGENINIFERAALSLGLSIVIVLIIGLILNYTPFGIRLLYVILVLFTFTIVFATIAVIRQYQGQVAQ